jgi:hypothetical protein
VGDLPVDDRTTGELSGHTTRSNSVNAGSGSELYHVWALQAAVLACAAVVVFWGFYTLDHIAMLRAVGGPGGPFGALARYLAFDPQSLSDAIASLAGINAAVFGIVITVVSIIVQLTAERYTGVARMFLRDPVNAMVAAFYVVSCVVSVWLAASLQSAFVPGATLAMALCLTTGGVVIMAPYFGYVFWFLEPRNIVRRIRVEAVRYASKSSESDDAAAVFDAQARMLFNLEELTDIANNSISGKDKIIASVAVDALKNFALQYLAMKSDAVESWFLIGPDIKSNPDFVAMDPESLTDLESRRTWVEWKVMRQYLSIHNEALASMRDVNYLIAIDTRYIGEAAAKCDDAELAELVFRFFNSYIRATLNARDVRTVYNILNQYRKLLESLLRCGQHRAALAGARHMKYYGLVGFEMNLNFVTETVAYDMSALAQLAHELDSTAENDILSEFLELDRAPFVRPQERALIGVRKAQVKLAAYYLACGQEARARAIADDMKDEPRERLRTVLAELSDVENKEFWEIIDRGRNFEYMHAEQRARLPEFFRWLDVELAVPAPQRGIGSEKRP